MVYLESVWVCMSIHTMYEKLLLLSLGRMTVLHT